MRTPKAPSAATFGFKKRTTLFAWFLVFSSFAVIKVEAQTNAKAKIKSSASQAQKLKPLAQATNETLLFEGYFQVLRGNEQIGYVIQRYEKDALSQVYRSIYLVKSQFDGNQVTESLKAEARLDFQPNNYQYTSQVNDQVKTIDGQFDGTKLKVVITENGQKTTKSEKMPPGIFLSTFLPLLIKEQDKTNGGYQVGKSFAYQAIAEETASITKGQAEIKSKSVHQGVPVFTVENIFNDQVFSSLVTAQGEALSTLSPQQNISTKLVKTPQEALQGQNLPIKILKTLFGSVPQGKKTPLHQPSLNEKPMPETKAKTQPKENS